MPSCRLTRRAEEDLLEIFLFSFERFGTGQAERYRMGLERCLQRLADNPRLGRSVPAIAPGVRRHEHETHIVLDEEAADGVLILALVHARSVRHLQI